MNDLSKKKRKKVSYARYGYWFVAPFVIGYILFSLYPLFNTFYYSTFEYVTRNRRTVVEFSGLTNYLNILGITEGEKANFLIYLGNTIRIWIFNFIPQILLSLLVAAWLTDNRFRLKRTGTYKVLVYMPNIITAASISILFCSLLSKYGPIMSQLRDLGWISDGTDIMLSKWGTGISISMILFWMWYGNTTLLLISGMIGINPSLYEAADLDGATGRQKFFHVTLPLLKPVMLYVLITSVIGGLQLYDIPALFNTGQGQALMGGPDDTSTTVTMYIMRLHNTDLGRASAVSVLLFIITLAVSLVFFFAMSDKSEERRLEAKRRRREKRYQERLLQEKGGEC
ncbi:MAG: sugar ABC transporter permease [Lachnospiraceae bacterium]|nr:sugar ABC transporter permease [Lachnospiraceae bacterium]